MNLITTDAIHRTVHKLPSLPAVVMELLATMEQEDVNISDLCNKIAKDQALAAKTLRLANSSFYGMTHQVGTIHEAITLLGSRTVRNLATTAALIGVFTSGKEHKFRVAPFWRHALACAICAKELAPHLNAPADQAYTGGLLHDIGRLVIATQFQSQYESTLTYRMTEGCSELEAEQAVLGMTHAGVGEVVARQWKLPLVIQSAIAGHHDASLVDLPPTTFVIMAADAIAHALDFSDDPCDLVPTVPSGFVKRLGLNEATLFQVFKNAEREFIPASLVLNP